MKNATEKLSKRNGDASYQDLIEKGYLKDAIVNYIALLGWSPKGEQEIFTLEELIQQFDIAGISKSPAIFDTAKLNYINGEYLRRLSPEAFYEKALPWMKKAVDLSHVNAKLLASVLQARTEVLCEIPEQIDFVSALPEYDLSLYVNKKMKTNQETALEALNAVLPVLEAIPEDQFLMEHIHEKLFALIGELGVKNGYLLWPLRVAVSGKQFTPGGGIELAAILGKTESCDRIRKGIALLSK